MDWRQHVGVDQEGYVKINIAYGQPLMPGLNPFVPGPIHAMDAHAGQSKFGLALGGEVRLPIDGDQYPLSAGEVGWAPAGSGHGLANESELPWVGLVGLAPPPGRAA